MKIIVITIVTNRRKNILSHRQRDGSDGAKKGKNYYFHVVFFCSSCSRFFTPLYYIHCCASTSLYISMSVSIYLNLSRSLSQFSSLFLFSMVFLLYPVHFMLQTIQRIFMLKASSAMRVRNMARQLNSNVTAMNIHTFNNTTIIVIINEMEFLYDVCFSFILSLQVLFIHRLLSLCISCLFCQEFI